MVARYWSSEQTVNTTTVGEQSFASAALLPNGNYLVAFTDNKAAAYEIRARLFGADGLAIVNGVTGNSNDFQVNTTTALDQTYSAAAGLPGGGFVVAFQDFSGSDNNIRARIFTAGGTPLGADFAVNTSTDYTQERPNVVGLAGGGFVVVYGDYSNNFNGNLADVRARLFAADGTPLVNGVTNNTNDFLVHASVGGNQLFPAVAALANGNFVVTYTDNSTFTVNADIRARIFSANGSPAGAEFTVNTTTASDQQQSAIAALTNGGFVVVFSDASDLTPGYGREVRARVFDASGTAINVNGSTNDFVVNVTHTGFQGTPSVAAAPDGGFLVTWQDGNGATDGVGQAIAGQLYDGAGNRVGTQFVVNQKALDSQAEPCAIALGDGRILVTWHDDNTSKTGDSTPYAVRSIIIDPREGIVTGTSSADLLYGNDFLSDQMSGAAGNDTLLGLGGNDTLDGGGDDDTLEGGLGNDVMNGGEGTDTASYANATAGVKVKLATLGSQNTGGAGSDTLSSFENLIGSNFADTLTGDGNDNELFGGAGDDSLVGGAGIDTMDGGEGNDTYTIDNDIIHDTGSGGMDVAITNRSTTLAIDSGIETLKGKVGSTGSLVLTGNDLVNRLIGNDGDNLLRGLASADSLFGGLGNDRLEGGLARDMLTGEDGADAFIFKAGDSAATATGFDIVNDFLTGVDKIDLDTIGAGGLPLAAYAETTAASATFSSAKNAATAAMADGAHSAVFVAGSVDGWLFWNTDGDLHTAEQAARLNGLNSIGAFDKGDLM